MKRTSLFQYARLRFLSKPVAERTIYRAIARQRARHFVEIGIGQGLLGQRMLAVARRFHEQEELCYTGIDLFETRPADQPGLSLKLAHRLLRPAAGKLQLVPGDAYTALSRSANTLVQSDIIVIAADIEKDAMTPAWFYIPRMLHDETSVFVVLDTDDDIDIVVKRVAHEQIRRLAVPAANSVRSAA